jgi:hypothetical protein
MIVSNIMTTFCYVEPGIAPEGNGRKEALGLGFRPPNLYGLGHDHQKKIRRAAAEGLCVTPCPTPLQKKAAKATSHVQHHERGHVYWACDPEYLSNES